MILLFALYLDGAVDLLEKDQPRQRVWQGYVSEREAFVRPLEQVL